MLRPNFVALKLIGDTVRAEGISDDEDVDDIIDIRVVLAQGDRIAAGPVDKLGVSAWHADLPVDDPEAKSAFHVGDAVVFGAQTHKENVTTTIWAQTLPISEQPEP